MAAVDVDSIVVVSVDAAPLNEYADVFEHYAGRVAGLRDVGVLYTKLKLVRLLVHLRQLDASVLILVDFIPDHLQIGEYQILHHDSTESILFDAVVRYRYFQVVSGEQVVL